MAVAPASMGDEIIVLDEDNEESPQPSVSAATPSSEHGSRNALPPKSQQVVVTHATKSASVSGKKDAQDLLAENQKLFSEFVEHCSSQTKECPEVLDYLQLKHSKTCPEFLSSVEFRNTLKGCLNRVQNNRSKTFVFINELCTVLKQHRDKRRLTLSKAAPSTSTSGLVQSTSNKSEDEQPSTSAVQEDNKEEDEKEGNKSKRALRKQIAYLENLLKVYNDEIFRLQQTELSLNDLEAEDSIYIQEHKLKRKLMKIYEKLCELKGCNTLTGRAIEEKIEYKSTRYPEINKRIQRFINSPEVQRNPPDYQDILQQVLRANERHNLCLTRSHLNQIAQEAFRETGDLLQRRRLNDMVYNFGSHLTDNYKPTSDPALSDPSLHQKLRSNREVAMSRLEEVISKYAVKQEDVEEQERLRRQGKDLANKEVKTKETNGVEEEEEEEDEEDDEEDESSDPDIKDEIEASTQQDGPDDVDDDDDDDDGNEAENASEGDIKGEQTYDQSPDMDETKSQISQISDISLPQSPAHSEPAQADNDQPLVNGNSDRPQEPTDSSVQVSPVFVTPLKSTEAPSGRSSGDKPSSEQQTVEKCDAQTTNGTEALSSTRATRSQKRKREETMPKDSKKINLIIIHDSEAEIPLDMGVCSSPHHEQSFRAATPPKSLGRGSPSTPPPKKNKVNVATQCDPDEVIVLD